MRIKVGHRHYVVQPLPEDRRKALDGLCHLHTGVIELNPDNPPQVQAETLLHELLHAVWEAGGVTRVGRRDEETVVSLLSLGLERVMVDSPEAFEVINQGLAGTPIVKD